jgi:hypothetical protein
MGRHHVTTDSVSIFAIALVFYAVTLAPAVIWGDSASLALNALSGSVSLTTAGDHPLFILVGRWFSALPGDPARNVNFAAAVFGALAVMLVYRCSRLLGTSRFAALTGAAALCVSHAFWLHSVIAEVYTANAFFLLATITLLLEWQRREDWRWLFAATTMFVVGLSNHLVLASMIPAGIAFVVATAGRKLFTRRTFTGLLVAVTAAVVVGAVEVDSVKDALRRLWYGPPGIGEYLGLNVDLGASGREAAYYVFYLIYQFPSISLLLGLIGAVSILRNRLPVAALLLLTIGVNAFLFIRHTVWPSLGNEKYVFYIADYAVFAILCAIGVDYVMSRLTVQRPLPQSNRFATGFVFAAVALVPPIFYAIVPSIVKRAGVDLVHARTLPYRDNDRFFLNPNKRGEEGAKRFGEDALRAVKPNSVIFADHSPSAVLRYVQVVERIRLDVRLDVPVPIGGVVPVTWMFENGQRRPIYVASLSPGYYDLSPLGPFVAVPTGPIFELCPP